MNLKQTMGIFMQAESRLKAKKGSSSSSSSLESDDSRKARNQREKRKKQREKDWEEAAKVGLSNNLSSLPLVSSPDPPPQHSPGTIEQHTMPPIDVSDVVSFGGAANVRRSDDDCQSSP
uniref:Uncharacterized protein n=1 Tax=Pristionchus pacificus TaxID=54126 RepID=A0A2A6BNA6_PRIPA|eukprot:PDM67397.1 hypothetical protein PRIPAC_48814 [Pristionchus pacificus]